MAVLAISVANQSNGTAQLPAEEKPTRNDIATQKAPSGFPMILDKCKNRLKRPFPLLPKARHPLAQMGRATPMWHQRKLSRPLTLAPAIPSL